MQRDLDYRVVIDTTPTLIFSAAKQGGNIGSMLTGGLGKSGARRFDQTAAGKVKFDDVAGIDEAEAELVEIVDFLKDPAKYTRLGRWPERRAFRSSR